MITEQICVALRTVVMQCSYYYSVCYGWSYRPILARSAKLPEGLYILPMFFQYFFYFFLMVDFLALVAQTLMEQSSPKFQDW